MFGWWVYARIPLTGLASMSSSRWARILDDTDRLTSECFHLAKTPISLLLISQSNICRFSIGSTIVKTISGRWVCRSLCTFSHHNEEVGVRRSTGELWAHESLSLRHRKWAWSFNTSYTSPTVLINTWFRPDRFTHLSLRRDVYPLKPFFGHKTYNKPRDLHTGGKLEEKGRVSSVFRKCAPIHVGWGRGSGEFDLSCPFLVVRQETCVRGSESFKHEWRR